jgi:hypothetical protein
MTKRSKPLEKPHQGSVRAGTTSQNHIRVKTGHPRLRSDSHEARSMGRLDPREIFDSHDPGSSRSTLPHPPTYRQKSRHLMQPPTTSYPCGYNTASMEAVPVSNPAFLLPIPGWAVKIYHCTHHAGYCSIIDAPSRHNTTTVISWD